MKMIYGLLDPVTHEVKYVGQSANPELRRQMHMSLAKRGDKPVHHWVKGLLPLEPVLVVLERVENRRVRGVALASVMEAKWLKRFRRTMLNYDKKQCAAYDEFVNAPEINHKFYAKP